MLKLLMVWMVGIVSLGSDVRAQAPTTGGTLAGKWKSTVVPAKGEAPMVDPEFTVETKADSVIVTMGPDRIPVAATVFDGGTGAGTFLMLKKNMGRDGVAATVIIRPAETGRVQVEYFVEYPAGARSRNFYYSEVFARAK